MIDKNKPLWQLTVAEFMELNASMQPTPEAEPEEEIYMTTQEVIDYLKVSKSTVVRWKKDLYLPSEKKGGILRFKKSEVDKVLNR